MYPNYDDVGGSFKSTSLVCISLEQKLPFILNFIVDKKQMYIE